MLALDTSALFAILMEEDDAEIFATQAIKAKSPLLSGASLVELGALMVRRFPSDGLEQMEALLALLRVEIVDFDRLQADLAIDAYRRFGKGSGSAAKLNLGDCYSYALARFKNLPLLFKGDDFIHTDIRSALS